ncbi:hypothetical protein BHAOGJBA_5547 [Methylobacterium hispanicum]|jgi:hypothetical protein|uniref:Uncharacterized protein n=1 Tax=Methylobacterium hispanicum TaxID=270350 RepID=A0AAV4ZVS5_9HYPH|nr:MULTISPECIES: hypothetical protein [Methylobacterium]GJD91994.1 hypothetical protein BHAOGJBA_5547 [Methylobacterium hispanicum]
MRATNKHFMLYVAGVAAIGVVIVALFMQTGPTRDQVRAASGTPQPTDTVSGRP